MTGFSTQKLDNYLDEIFRSGFPGIRARSTKAGKLFPALTKAPKHFMLDPAIAMLGL